GPIQIEAHAVPAAALPEVVDDPLPGQRAVGRQVERPDLAVAADPGMAVDHVERPVVRRDGDAVGAVDLLLRQHPLDLSRAVEAIDGLDVHLQVAAVGPVAWVSEPDAAIAIDAAVVGAVVALAVVPVGQHRDGAGLHVGADDAAAQALLAALTTDEPA